MAVLKIEREAAASAQGLPIHYDTLENLPTSRSINPRRRS